MVILLIAFCICVCTLPMAHRLTTPQILLDMEDSEQEFILGGHYAEKVNNPNTTPIKVDTVKYKIRASIDNFYDMQKLRIQCGNRICAAIRQTDDETENDNILKTLASEYNRVTDVLAEKYKSSHRSLGKAIKATDDLEIIKSEIDYNMAEQYVALLNQEQQISKFISYLDIHKARYVSYASVGTRATDDPDAPRVAMSRKALVDAVYLDKDAQVNWI